MKLKEIKELIELVNDKGFAEFEIKDRGFRLRISQFKEPNQHILQPASAPIIISSAIPGTTEITASGGHRALIENESPDNASPDSSRDAAVESQPDLHIIKSPIVGTFYSAPSPTSEPFVKTGDHIEPDTVVCIIEAMKLMNEIQAEVSGDIVRTYVENGQPVEYGQPLFGIRV
jgi:acetyl-CoA carboxylase biotin carboxyl carrier protein